MKQSFLPFLLLLFGFASFSTASNDSSHRPNKVNIEQNIVMAQKILSINDWHLEEIENLIANYKNIESILVKNFFAMLISLSDLHHLRGPQETAALYLSQGFLYKNAWYASIDVAQSLGQSDEWNFKENPAWHAAVEHIEDARDDVLCKNRSNISMTVEQNASINEAEQSIRKILTQAAYNGTKHALEKLSFASAELRRTSSQALATIYILALLNQSDALGRHLTPFLIIFNNDQFRALSGSAFNESMAKVMDRLPELEHNVYFTSCKELMNVITAEQSTL